MSLTLRLGKPAVGNDINADGKGLIVVTGANQGGKSTFLRSFGAAQLMMQAGMFVGAEAFTADVRDRVFTHYKREEDESMESGKFDEELTRMSAIAQQITPAACSSATSRSRQPMNAKGLRSHGRSFTRCARPA